MEKIREYQGIPVWTLLPARFPSLARFFRRSPSQILTRQTIPSLLHDYISHSQNKEPKYGRKNWRCFHIISHTWEIIKLN